MADDDDCAACNGEGYICGKCRNAAGDCTCADGIDEVECDECHGTGGSD